MTSAKIKLLSLEGHSRQGGRPPIGGFSLGRVSGAKGLSASFPVESWRDVSQHMTAQPARAFNIFDAMASPHVWATWFTDAKSGRNWRTFLAVLLGCR